ARGRLGATLRAQVGGGALALVGGALPLVGCRFAVRGVVCRRGRRLAVRSVAVRSLAVRSLADDRRGQRRRQIAGGAEFGSRRQIVLEPAGLELRPRVVVAG